MQPDFTIHHFPLQTFDKIRNAHTDRQGHVNNAVFATFPEIRRVEILFNPQFAVLGENASFVVAALHILQNWLLPEKYWKSI